MASFSKSERSGIVYDNLNITIGALANATAVVQGSRIDAARENGFRVLKTEYWTEWQGFTAGEGPIMMGIAAGQATGGIKSAIEADPQSGSASDAQALMDSMRPVWPLEYMSAREAAQLGIQFKGVVNIRWSIIEGMALNWFMHNISGSTLTTGGSVKVFAKHFGVWLRD